MRFNSRLSISTAALALVGLLIAAQALVNAAAPLATNGKSTGQAVGHTSFALLGGLRTFAAASLLNRLDPIHDTYFGHSQSIVREKYLLPSLRMVTILDPKMVNAYYTASYLVSKGGDPALGVNIAREGVANNPESGYLRANLVQALMMQDERANLPEMLKESRLGLGSNMQWRNAGELFEALAIFRATFRLAGDAQTALRMEEAGNRLKQTNDIGSVAPILKSLPASSAISTGAAQ